MKLKSFRISNYKSIVDSGECRLSDHDNITVIAGQNESGKSSILQALRDFENGEINAESLRDDELNPSITCTFCEVGKDFDDTEMFEEVEMPEQVIKLLKSLYEVEITKTLDEDGQMITNLSKDLTNEILSIVEKENAKIEKKNNDISSGASGEPLETSCDTEATLAEIITEILSYSPNIIFFDDFCDLLPEKILVSDVVNDNENAKGLHAVKNIETILNADFSTLDNLPDGRRETTQTSYHETITADFNEKWKQRIGEGSGAKVHVKHYRDEKGVSYLKFYIETKKGEFLSVEKRSQGFKWFLSFYLHLKAESKRTESLIILFDEPGLYLHSKAQLDMIQVFEELSIKNQIIYSTHSPYLIDTTKLHRLRLVINTKDHGTTIEKITSIKIQNQKDALKPIIDALGLEVASPFSVAKKNNIIVEGISDFHYFQALKILLQKRYEIGILPSMGSSSCHLLMELCIGWGLNWVIIFDDKGATNDYKKIKKSFFNDNEDQTRKMIYKLPGCDGIEDMFNANDLKLVNPASTFSDERKNSDAVSENGGKELYSRLFFEKVKSKEITKDKLSRAAIENFERVFDFIETAFDLKQ